MKQLVLAFTLVACTASPKKLRLEGTPPLPAGSSLTVHVAGPVVELTATALDDKGKVIKGVHVGFRSSDPKVATVDAKGHVIALKSGNARIAAKADKAQEEVTVVVSIPARLELCPNDQRQLGRCPKTAAPVALPAGHVTDAPLGIFDDTGHAVDTDEASGPTIVFTSNTPEVATVDSHGNVTAQKPGQAIVTARVGPLSATLPVKVSIADFNKVTAPKSLRLKVGESKPLAAAAHAKSKVVDGVGFAWTSSAPDVVSIASGACKGEKKGKATLTASAGGKSAKVAVVVK